MKEIIIAIFILLGSLFILIAAIGLIRFGDVFSRLHATTKAPSFGMLLLLLAVCLFFSSLTLTFKAVMLILFIYLTAPLAAHSISKANQKK
jgi:multicomponent Na+:H+ antiporter subunit G